MTDYRRPALLDPQRHDRAAFDCGEPALDDWLKRYAGQSRRGDTAATWVITDGADAVVAYASLAMTAIDRSSAPAKIRKGSPDPVPALLLGRLAVDRPHHGLGLGTALVAHVLATALELNTKAACKAVVVSALSADAHRWWTRLGFQPLEPNEPTSLDLYLLTSTIQVTLRSL